MPDHHTAQIMPPKTINEQEVAWIVKTVIPETVSRVDPACAAPLTHGNRYAQRLSASLFTITSAPRCAGRPHVERAQGQPLRDCSSPVAVNELAD
eukprot:7390889-Prymnesium_polylepis.2